MKLFSFLSEDVNKGFIVEFSSKFTCELSLYKGVHFSLFAEFRITHLHFEYVLFVMQRTDVHVHSLRRDKLI